MKKLFYTFLMMVFTTLMSFFVYLSVLTILARHRIIPLEKLDSTLWFLTSLDVYLFVGFIWVIWGYIMAEKWWKIIYVDGVYYFNTKKKREIRRRTPNKTI
jgi:hypothetical protein